VRYYLLNEDKTVRVVEDVLEWAKSHERRDSNRFVANTEIGPYRVSTVFLGLDHNHGMGRPHIFETMVFGSGNYDEQDQARYSTYQEAIDGHDAMCNKVRVLLGQDPQ
jgi:20S proteasome alpha/beta subunit